MYASDPVYVYVYINMWSLVMPTYIYICTCGSMLMS